MQVQISVYVYESGLVSLMVKEYRVWLLLLGVWVGQMTSTHLIIFFVRISTTVPGMW